MVDSEVIAGVINNEQAVVYMYKLEDSNQVKSLGKVISYISYIKINEMLEDSNLSELMLKIKSRF